MNRDERLTRDAGLAPKKKVVDRRTVLCPSERSGGTWIALNDGRTSFALINWYSVVARVRANPVSRGKVINAVSATTSSNVADAKLARLPLSQINPFRLIGVFPESREIIEWRWDLKKLTCDNHRWKPQQWVSSGFDEPTAQCIRGDNFHKAQKQRSTGTLSWLRRLHRSHSPETGPFSTCMHRSDAATVSYTEIIALSKKVGLRYDALAPCRTHLSSSGWISSTDWL